MGRRGVDLIVFSQVAAFFDAVSGILSLDSAVILGLQTAPNGLTVSIAILVLATVSDVVGNSPVLFIRKMPPGRLVATMAVETVLSLARLAIWMCSFGILVFAMNQGSVNLANVVLVIGIGYAPMLWSFLVVIPTIGPLIRRVLVAWTLVTITASLAVASSSTPWDVVVGPGVAALVILVVHRSSNRVSVALLGRVSRRLTGVDLMARTRAMDPLLVMAESTQGARRSVPSA